MWRFGVDHLPFLFKLCLKLPVHSLRFWTNFQPPVSFVLALSISFMSKRHPLGILHRTNNVFILFWQTSTIFSTVDRDRGNFPPTCGGLFVGAISVVVWITIIGAEPTESPLQSSYQALYPSLLFLYQSTSSPE